MSVFLKDTIQFAPYNWNWYAWSHLIAPHTAGANIAERHMKIMQSFIEAPHLHQEAIQLRGMIGGPFINLAPTFKEQISELLANTTIKCQKLLQLQKDFKEFSQFLAQEATGFSMDMLYEKLPASLKGMCELVYDLHHKPQVRLIEKLLYDRYYDDSEQTICFADTKDDSRSFSLSTPYVERQDTVQLKLPFASPVIDTLAKMKSVGAPFDDVMQLCDVPDNKIDLFRSFFSADCTKPMNQPYTDQGIRVRYLGHASVLLETKDVAILVDPVLGYQPDPLSHDRFTAAHLPAKIDYVLITHNHQDHLLLETLLQLRYKIKHIVVPSCNNGMFADPSLKLMLSKLGFKSVITLDEFEQITFSNGQITALPFYGEHGDLNIQTKRAYHISLFKQTFLFLADSNNLDPMLYEHVANQLGDVETIFIGMECKGAPLSWLYGPLLPTAIARQHDQSRRLSGSNAEKAWHVVKLFSPKAVYVYAMGMEPWLSYIMAIHYDDNSMPIVESNKFIATCREHTILSKRLYGRDEWVYAL